MTSPVKFSVFADDAGIRLDRYIKQKLADKFTTSQIQWGIEHHLCSINGKIERFPSYKIKTGDKVLLHISQVPNELIKKEKWDKNRIIYEDQSILVYNKPSGIASDEKELFSQIKTYCPTALPVHRLDKETSGLILFAKNKDSAQSLLRQFKNREVKKTYLALVAGIPKIAKGHIKNYIGKIHAKSQHIWGVVIKEEGSLAETSWEIVQQGKDTALIRCYPLTGRTHQIRIHLAHIGYPILGDSIYGKRHLSQKIVSRLMLHAQSIAFYHPQTKKYISFTIPEPTCFGLS